MRWLGYFFIFCTTLWGAESEKPYYLSVCTMFKDEPAYPREWVDMQEWLVYNQLQGVEHFFIYPHNCTPEFLERFTPYVEQGLVTLIEYMDAPSTWVFTHLQEDCFNHFLHNYGHLTEWCAIIDADEFFLPQQCDTMVEYLQSFDATDIHQILVFWKCFGTSDWQSLPLDHLMTEHFVRCLNHDKNPFVNLAPQNITKGIFRPQYTKQAKIHAHHLSEGSTYKPTRDEIQLNHYITKDIQFYTEIKAKRSNSGGGSAKNYQKTLTIYNEEEDTTIKKHLPALKARLTQAS